MNLMDVALAMAQNNMNNPIVGNALKMAKSGDLNGVEQLARSICKEKGINPDEIYKNMENKFRY